MKLKPILTFLLCFAVVYFAAAFISAEIDFTKWKAEGRFIVIVVTAFTFFWVRLYESLSKQ